MNWLYYILISVIVTYGLLMLTIIIGWVISNAKRVQIENSLTNFSVLIPFRNEKINLKQLVASLSMLEYDRNKLEFFFIDDHSEDGGGELLEEELNNFPFNYQVVFLNEDEQGKKRAIQKGVGLAKASFIVTTDADCTFNSKWLYEASKLINAGSEFIISPVVNKEKEGVLSQLQQIESLMLAGVTQGTASLKVPLLCSGANLVYAKSLFEKLNPYQDNLNIRSGDDMFFLQQVLKNENIQVDFTSNKASCVKTEAPNSFKEMYSRSMRWSSKTSQLGILSTSIFGAIVLITNYSVLFMAVMCLFLDDSIEIFIKLCGIKIIIDVLFLVIIANHYKRYKTLFYLPIMVVFYPIYLLLVSVGSIFTKPTWKGR